MLTQFYIHFYLILNTIALIIELIIRNTSKSIIIIKSGLIINLFKNMSKHLQNM